MLLLPSARSRWHWSWFVGLDQFLAVFPLVVCFAGLALIDCLLHPGHAPELLLAGGVISFEDFAFFNHRQVLYCDLTLNRAGNVPTFFVNFLGKALQLLRGRAEQLLELFPNRSVIWPDCREHPRMIKIRSERLFQVTALLH